MQSLEGACEEGERAIKKIKTNRSLPLLQSQDSSEAHSLGQTQFCLSSKFLVLYKEESAKDNRGETGLKGNSLILQKVVAKERLNTLILNLHPGNKGYSLAFRTLPRENQHSDDTANMIETKQWPYEMDELLRYIDNEELPPYLSNLFEMHYSFLFYSGCIIAEVRDYRQAFPHFSCDIHYVLLRPTLKSLLADINNIVEERTDWGIEERQQMESQILLANMPSLCLDPNNTLGTIQSRINHNRQMWNTNRFRRAARKFSQVTVNRKRKLDQFTHRHGLELYEFLTKSKTKPKTATIPAKVKEISKPIPVPNLDAPSISPPTQGLYIKELKTYALPKDTSDCSPKLLEEYVLETEMPSKEKGKKRVYHIKLSILQRQSNSEYLGELYLDRDHKTNERNGVACRFSLGSRANVNRYVHQFTEIFTESGRKSVTIKYGNSRMAQAQAQNAGQTNLAQQHLTQLNQSLQQNQSPLVNGTTIASRISLVQQSQSVHQNTSNVPILQSHLQTNPPSQVSNQQSKINALATELMNSAQQFQAKANAKQQQQQLQPQQQQKLVTNRNNVEIINLLNSSPASNINSDASAVVANAINNPSTLLPQTLNQKLLARKMTLSNVANARVLNHGNLIAVNNNNNNNRVNLTDLNQQTITLASGGNYTNYTVPIKQQQQISEIKNSSLSALLVGTPAADRLDIKGPNTNSLLLKKLASSPNPQQLIKTGSGQSFVVQSPSPKLNTVLSPMSSPPIPQQQNTINVQSLNFAQLQNLQNVQFPGFAQPIALLNMSGSQVPSILVTLPVTTTTANTVTQTAGNSSAIGGPTVVLTNAGSSSIAQLVASGGGGKQPALRNIGQVNPANQFQLIQPMQRSRQQQQSGIQANRTVQRTPITIKMAAASPNANPSISQLQVQQYQQLCLNQQQQQKSPGVAVRRRSNTSEQQ